MKRRFQILIIALFMILCFGSVLAAPTVTLDGKQLSFDSPPVIENNTNLVPMRDIFKELGADISWDGSTQTVTANKQTLHQNISIKLTIGQTTAYKNNSPVQLDVPAKIINQRTMVPLRFVSEALDVMVGWDSNTQVISLGYAPLTGTIPIPPQPETRVHFIDVGQADSIYIQLPDNIDILIDGGNVGDGQTVVNYLKGQNVNDIELLIATHPHEDHIGALPEVLSAFKVEKIIDSGKTATSKIYNSYAASAKAEGCPWESDNKQSFSWGNTSMQIFTANETWQDVNDYSVVSRLDCGDIEFLFQGDAETPVESILQGDISAEVLKVGHHGSSSSSSASFLSRVNPQIAVISVGTGNTYGHPAQETLNKLQSVGAKILRTDLEGTIVITTDGKTLSSRYGKVGSIASVTSNIQPSSQPSTQTQKNQSYTVFVTKSGTKYHKAGCSYLKSSQIPMSLEDAEAAGYTPCLVCNPY